MSNQCLTNIQAKFSHVILHIFLEKLHRNFFNFLKQWPSQKKSTDKARQSRLFVSHQPLDHDAGGWSLLIIDYAEVNFFPVLLKITKGIKCFRITYKYEGMAHQKNNNES